MIALTMPEIKVDNTIYGKEYLSFLIAVLLRWAISLHSYSGEKMPPMFGDYEAQRHWMEITYNLPISEWYRNTTDNDLMYWGLDYPPLTAYHSYLCSFIASIFLPHSVKLHSSRGFETYHHKLFMRITVLVADLLTFFPAIYLYFFKCGQPGSPSKSTEKTEFSIWTYIILALLYPGLILIDHGHFQYNCVSLGLFVASVNFLKWKRDIFCALFFTLSLNYKQMELYHAIPFFCYFTGQFFRDWKKASPYLAFKKLLVIVATVIITFAFLWLPFMLNLSNATNVISRIFPVARGVFEDKVSNFWCIFNVVYKLHNINNNSLVLIICLVSTLLTNVPTSILLLRNPSFSNFVLSAINSSLAFFLFSYQVHEKSILLAAIPIILYFPTDLFVSFWFLFISTFSMLPLFIKDNLFIAFLSTLLIYYLIFVAFVNSKSKVIKSKNDKSMYLIIVNFVSKTYLFYLSLFGCFILTILSKCCNPPTRYPDLWPLAVSFYSFCHFFAFFIYFNYKQYRLNFYLKKKTG